MLLFRCLFLFPLPLLLLLLLLSPNTWAAACCGGGFAAPSLIVGDDKAQLTASYGYSRVTDDVGTDSLWRRRGSRETTETLKLEGAHVFADRWQAGLSVPVVKRSRAGDSSSGLGDVSGTLGYEYLPDWDYNPWRPRGLGFFQLTLPTGRSINESDATYQLDARGRGFWALGVGTILTKILGRWDLYSSLDAHRSFDKSFSNSQSSGRLKPGFGGNFGLGAGYSRSALRLGAGLTWTYEDPIDVEGTTPSEGSPQRYATATLTASYLFPEELAATISYADQTLFGDPVNTTLGRGVMIFVQKRWLR
ncbi:MAG: serine protease spb1 [Bdellovibrionales bacterium]